MNQTHARRSAKPRPTIDVTPGAGWRRGMRGAGLAMVPGLGLAVVLPVLWFLGALALLTMLGGVAVMLLWGMVRQAMPPRGRCGQGHRIGAAD